MSAESTLILTGLLIAITPFLGLPSVWYSYIFAILGLLVLGIGLLLRARRMASIHHTETSPAQETDTTRDSEPPHEPSPMS